MYPKELKSCSGRDSYAPTYMAASLTITKRWKQPECPSMDEQINKVWLIQKTEYYLAFKRKEILSRATIWRSLEDIMLSEITNQKKTSTAVFHL